MLKPEALIPGWGGGIILTLNEQTPENVREIYDNLNSLFENNKPFSIYIYDTGIGSNLGLAERIYKADNGTIYIQHICEIENKINLINYYFYANYGYYREVINIDYTKLDTLETLETVPILNTEIDKLFLIADI